MLNPWVGVMFLVLLITTSVGAYRFGVKHERGEAALRQEQAIQQLQEVHNANVKLDMEAARRAEANRQKARAAQVARRHASELLIAKESRPGCDRSPAAMELLDSAIDAANGDQTPAPGSVPDKLREAPKTFWPFRGGITPLGGGRHKFIWRMSQ